MHTYIAPDMDYRVPIAQKNAKWGPYKKMAARIVQKGLPRIIFMTFLIGLMSPSIVCLAIAPVSDISDLARLTPGRTAAQNALWIENPLSARFNSSKQVVVADIKDPAVITMIHFAMPQVLKLNRDLLLKMYWDGETAPSVDCPLVDFFCDPAGLREEVNTALVNKRRGFNAYFPMPFRKSAKIELVYDGPIEPGEELWKTMPCYSYVMYRTVDRITKDTGYFHAHWRQEGLLLGKRDYVALEAKGKGKFVGWNVTIRRPGRSGYPVDGNEKFYIDGEQVPSIEFQGLEDSFGFSWGFPETQSMFPLTGYFPFFKGALGYRFFINDAISFRKSLRVAIGFGTNEHTMFRREFSKRGSTLQLSSVVYWYQVEPHASLPPMPPAAERAPAPEEPFWPDKEELPTPEALKKRGCSLLMLCGRPEQEIIHAEAGFATVAKSGYTYDGWNLPVYHCRAGDQELKIELKVPKAAQGTVRLYMVDPDNFQGGRKQTVTVAGKSLGLVEDFQKGRWLEKPIGPSESADGKILIQARNARQGSNAVISIIEWLQKK
ncbi:MAG TPA: glycoside hydrolase family 172 protein [Sedimentisphaerales bacterium]|nr:glycoside hydrolase family 172 protein [Sedimentisphaerales bacterium]